MNAAKELYDRIDLAWIRSAIEERRPEDVHLDFKMLAGPGIKSEDDKKNLARALSGFANSDGGVIVWGVDARKDNDGIDGADKEVPIEGLRILKSRLIELSSQLVNPVVDGVEHDIIHLPDSEDAGFAKTYIPASDRGPHMAKAGEDRYFKRNQGSFIRMEHFDIEDMFGRRARPELKIAYELEPGGRYSTPRGMVFRVIITFAIENIGRGLARYLHVELDLTASTRIPCNPITLDRNGSDGLPRIRTRPGPDTQRVYGGSSDQVIHPASSLGVTAFRMEIAEELLPLPPDVRIRYTIAAEGFPRRSGEIVIPGKDFAEVVSTNRKS